MRSRWAQTTLVLMLIITIGGHWIVLQSVAWFGMAVNYSQSTSLTTALKKTFDGKNPCQLCKLVKAGKDAEKNEPISKTVDKIDLFNRTVSFSFYPPHSFRWLDFPAQAISSRSDAPPGPPPRVA